MDDSKQASSPEGSADPSLVSEEGKNVKAVLCQRCGSKVLCPGMALFAEKEVKHFKYSYGSYVISHDN